MSIGQALQSLFGGSSAPAPAAPPASPASQTTQNPGATAPGTSSTLPPNGMIPGNADGTPNTGSAAAPMAEFAKLWETKSNDGTGNQSLFANIDPAKVQEAAGKVNFAQVVGAETLSKIQAGGPEAAQAFVEAMNKVSQTVYAQSAVATTQLIDRALAEQNTRFEAKLPDLIKRQNASDGIKGDNAIFSNPAVAPVVGMIQSQVASAYPNATAAEQKEMTKAYFKQLTDAIAPPAKPATPKGGKKGDDGFDWEAFANT
jgi:hypothetical protein